jgi:hypothetical protein
LRRLASSLLLGITLTAAALTPGAAVLASGSTPTTSACPPPLDEEGLRLLVTSSPLVVIGTVNEVSNPESATGTFSVAPEAFLRGSASTRAIRFEREGPMMPCGQSGMSVNDRVLIAAQDGTEPFSWPFVEATFFLTNGEARSANPADTRVWSETELVETIRGHTGQFVVPAQSEDEGEGIEWGTTVLPIAVALGIVFVIGLFLMRIWHRIDPS